ncbi:DUF6705 family protein [Flavobacterium psychrotrophum]|uniref:DUF6705 family protein n=1 Tax=Flavobacterium psychrotrophum TaxID=2294119 RepID=UPI000E311224|nr:DUF6705 family protein [Flavobacterium psychrotrophum]
MKKTLTILCFITCCITYGQDVVKPIEQYYTYSDQNNIYFKDVNLILNKFLGSWEYSTQNEYFKITLVKYEKTKVQATTLSQHTDRINTDFIYKQKINNEWVTVYNTYSSQGNPGSFYIWGDEVKNFSVIILFYTEPPVSGTCERNRYGNIVLDFVTSAQGSAPKIQWQRQEISLGYNPNEPCPDGTARDATSFKIPAEMLLTKIN